MSSQRDSKQDSSEVTAEPATIYRDTKPGAGSGASDHAPVDAALSAKGSGMAHESGATFHDDSTSHAAADALGANAFTAGSDVYFGAGQLAPNTPGGDKLIQHELTHVEQSRGVEAPTPGNFNVSSHDDAAEVAARSGSGGGSGSAGTIYRDDKTGGKPPAHDPPPKEGGGGDKDKGKSADPYETWKKHVNGFDKTNAISEWTALAPDQKAKVATEGKDFLKQVIYVMGKSSPDVLKTANADMVDYAYTIFANKEFADWLPNMRAAGLLTPFINAEPKGGTSPNDLVTKLDAWVAAAANVGEARPMFEKFYPKLNDNASPALAFGASPSMWTLEPIQRLYHSLSHFLPVGHMATITGGFNIQANKGFGWYEGGNFRIAVPAKTSTAAGDHFKHGMSGGDNSGADTSYTKKDGTAGANTQMSHFETTALHEIGHGVGARMGGNAYAEDSGKYPGWTQMTSQTWANGLWTAPTGTGDATVPQEAQLDEEHAKEMMIHEIEKGAGTYKYNRGWFKSDPSNPDMAKWIKTKYANVPLLKWWDYLVAQGKDKDSSYKWDAPDARTVGTWTFGFLTRADSNYMKLKTEAYNKKVSWYSTSSPDEWFAEQYAQYYRTEKTGGGLIDSSTMTLLDDLDKKAFAPTNTAGTEGVTYNHGGAQGGADAQGGGAGAGGGGGGGAGAGAQGGGATVGNSPAPTNPEATRDAPQPLFFPW